MGKMSEALGRYMKYLYGLSLKEKGSLWDQHQKALSRETAKEYGVTEAEMKRLDECLPGKGGDQDESNENIV